VSKFNSVESKNKQTKKQINKQTNKHTNKQTHSIHKYNRNSDKPNPEKIPSLKLQIEHKHNFEKEECIDNQNQLYKKICGCGFSVQFEKM
jgi:hypothetical protein